MRVNDVNLTKLRVKKRTDIKRRTTHAFTHSAQLAPVVATRFVKCVAYLCSLINELIFILFYTVVICCFVCLLSVQLLRWFSVRLR